MIIDDFNVLSEHYNALTRYQSLLFKWNKSINLISKASEHNFWERHIKDSLQLLTYIDRTKSVVDIGSGAGLPGLILSIGGVLNVTLVECNSRKSTFLREASKLSPNRVTIIEKRLDSNFRGSYDILTCRGLSKINIILSLTSSLNIGKILLLKGKSYDQEIYEARKNHWLFDLAIHNSVTGSGKIIEISNIRKSI